MTERPRFSRRALTYSIREIVNSVTAATIMTEVLTGLYSSHKLFLNTTERANVFIFFQSLNNEL